MVRGPEITWENVVFGLGLKVKKDVLTDFFHRLFNHEISLKVWIGLNSEWDSHPRIFTAVTVYHVLAMTSRFDI